MNIFVLDRDPKLAAQYHCDKHCVKMILESAQMLCTAHRVLDNSQEPALYKATHINHPCSKWVRLSKENYQWLYNLFVELCKEYTYRYGKIHLCETKLKSLLSRVPQNIGDGSLTPFAQAMANEYKHSDPVIAYRRYYVHEKAGLAAWTKKRQVPKWFVDYLAKESERSKLW